MFEDFSHFLAYGSTDQETLRELTDEYQGLVVPGTIAAYQSQGTRGFVLTLSASIQKPYVIDPRTPLFQYFNPAPKQSHLALASILGIEDLVSAHGFLTAEQWISRAPAVAEAWIDFNSGYNQIAPKQFDKYARRLGRRPDVADASLPTWILAPYLMAGTSLDVRDINDLLWESAHSAAGSQSASLRRVIAARQPAEIVQAATGFDEPEFVLWVDDLDEVDPMNESRLREFATSVSELSKMGKRPAGLYGGYFSVLLRSVGLAGASHGVGFSEHRNHVELKTSGGAPARFYVQRLHRYLPVDAASELWRKDPALVESYFPGYESRDPVEYDYHDLMKLSVRARANEILRVEDSTPAELVDELRTAFGTYTTELSRVSINSAVLKRVQGSLLHIPAWANALEVVT